MKETLLIIVLSFIGLHISAETYYVKIGGSDTAEGTSDATAWAHHPWMIGWSGNTVLKPGDNVYLKRGNIWTIKNPVTAFLNVRQSGNEGQSITLSAYGSGNKPILNISTDSDVPVIRAQGKSFIIIDGIEITHCNKVPYLSYQDGIQILINASVISHDWIIRNCTIHNIPRVGINGWGMCYNIFIGDLAAERCATKESFSNEIYDCGYAGISLLGRNPETNLSNFRVFYNYVHDILVGGKLTETKIDDAYGISFSWSDKGNIPGTEAIECIAKYNRIERVPCWHGLDSHGGQYISFLDNYIIDCHICIATSSSHLVIDNNVCEAKNLYPNVNYAYNFINAQGSAVAYSTDISIKNNVIFYTTPPSNSLENNATGIIVMKVDSTVIEGNKIFNAPVYSVQSGITIGNIGFPAKNVIIRNNFIYKWSPAIWILPDLLQGTLLINNNIIRSGRECIYGGGGTLASGVRIFIYNNSLVNDGDTPDLKIIHPLCKILEAGASIKIKNNLIGYLSRNLTGVYISTPSIIKGILEVNNNLYFNSLLSAPFQLYPALKDFKDWNNHGYDLNSLNGIDPLLLNISGRYSFLEDFKLQAMSPAINRGSNVGIKQDIFGASVKDLPDIGAIEY
jgi:hypothetical protein